MRIVAALGGNALLERGEAPDAEIQQHHILRAVAALAPLSAAHDLVITHGNGPQIGLLALESDADPALSRAYPLDALGAQTQGMIGYWLAQAMHNAVKTRIFGALVCQTIVHADDPAFSECVQVRRSGLSQSASRATGSRAELGDPARWSGVAPSRTLPDTA